MKKKNQIETILINDRYMIYTDNWVVYDTTKAKDIPQWVFDLAEIIKRSQVNNKN